MSKTMKRMISDRVNASRMGRHAKRMLALLTSTALIAANPAFAQSIPNALPTGGSVAAGSVTIGAPSSNGLVINQTSGSAVINWNSYNIGAGNTVTYVQPDAASAVLNRVTGSATTTIAGSIIANGQVYIVNPNGIAITSTGTVNAGAFVASTLDIGDDDFMAGRRTFTGNGASKEVSNAGQITIERGGYMALIGGSVDNSGTITVPMGRAALGSGESATLDLSGDGFLQVAIPTTAEGTKALVSNSGRISASGGAVQLKAAAAREMARQAVNMSGTVEAKGVSGTSGDIVLSGGEGEVHVSGKVDASNSTGKGGKVTVTGRSIKLVSAKVDASGKTGGGSVKIGGDRQGNGTTQRAATLAVDAATSIKADAISTGHGGDVVLWSDDLTSFAGTITARGGALSGNGGEVEVSGKALLSYTGLTDLTATNGSFGNLLLDPYNITISIGADTGGFAPSTNDSVVNVITLTNALARANVTVTTGAGNSAGMQAGNITVTAPITWAAATTLSLTAANNIDINAAITATTGGLTLNAGGTISATAAVSIGGIFNLASGSWVQNASSLPDFYAKDFRIGTRSFLRVTGGDGASAATAYRIADVYGMQGLSSAIGAHWTLANDIDASGTVNWNAGNSANGFRALASFNGTFDGNGRKISALTINSAVGNIGLFNSIGNDGVVSNLGMVEANFTSRGSNVGILAGTSSGSVYNVSSAGTVSGNNMVGGLVGLNLGTISNVYATGAVSGNSNVGGLVGQNGNTINNAYAMGSVSGSGSVGGLVGNNYGTISNIYATGSVSGNGPIGGLVGYNSATISNGYATGAVNGSSGLGGLVGQNLGQVSNSFWDIGTTGRSSGIGRNQSGTFSAVGLTTEQARVAASYTGWDFSSVWFQSADMRPILRSEAAVADANGVITISSLHQLALISANPDANYRLTGDLDATATRGQNASGIWGTGGWIPLASFHGTLDGNGHTISALTIDSSGNDVGLFAEIRNSGIVRNLNVVDATVASRGNGVGILAGINVGSILDVSVSGAVSGNDSVGGLVGNSWGMIGNTSAVVTVSGNELVGGLVGNNSGTVNNAYATGSVKGNGAVGGLVGWNRIAISNAYATGSVSGNGTIGGLVGYNLGTISQVYATGAVSGDRFVGGLVGQNTDQVINSFWDIETSGQLSGLGGNNSGSVSALGLTTMQMADPFRLIDVGWDFVGTWGTLKSGGAPVLRSVANAPIYQNYVRISGHLTSIYGDTNDSIDASRMRLDGIGAGNVNVGWGSAISDTTNAGTYLYSGQNVLALSYRNGTAGDYYIGYNGSLTVDKRALSVTANAVTKTYGDANPTLAYIATGLVNNDRLTGILTTAAGQYSDVGAYGITQGTLGNANYAISYTGADLTIDQRALTVTAVAQSKTYGNANPALNYTSTGLVNNDRLTGELSTFATQYSNVGAYGINQGTLAAPANYTITTYTGADLTINQRALTVTAVAQSKTYGDVNPELRYTSSGLVNNDELTGALFTSATQYSNVGDYGITLGSLGNENYDIDYTGTNLSVTARNLSVTAHNLNRYYGSSNPILTYTAIGLVNNDMLSGALATVADRSSTAGTYDITQGTLAASANYSLSFNPGTLTIDMLLSPPAGTMASTADAGRGSRGNAGRSTFDTGRFAAFATASSIPSRSADGADIVLNDPRFDGTVICLDGGGCVAAP